MPDPVVGMNKITAGRTAEAVRRTLGTLPPVGRRTRRVPRNGFGSGEGDGGGGSSGCCCNNANCVDLCDAIESDVITACAACPSGALKNYRFSIGKSVAFPEFGDDLTTGFITVTWDVACTWQSPTISVSGGVYRLNLVTDDGDLPYIDTVWVSGSDPLKLLDGYHQIRWLFNGSSSDYSCLCNMQFKLIEVQKVYKPKGLNSLICLLPLEVAALPPLCPQVINPETDEFVQPCVPTFEFPSLDLSSYGYMGSTNVTIQLEFVLDIDKQCRKVGVNYLVPPSHPPDDSDAVYVTASVWYAGGEVDLAFAVGLSGDSIRYTLDPGDWVIGTNTLTRLGASTNFPPTIAVVLTDCHFSTSHPDYGYGCGGDAGCTGEYFVIGLSDGLGGFNWFVDDAHPSTCSEGCNYAGSQDDVVAILGPASDGSTGSVPCKPLPPP